MSMYFKSEILKKIVSEIPLFNLPFITLNVVFFIFLKFCVMRGFVDVFLTEILILCLGNDYKNLRHKKLLKYPLIFYIDLVQLVNFKSLFQIVSAF